MSAAVKVACPVCGRPVRVRQDGTLGIHRMNATKDFAHLCPAGRQRARSMPAGRRITVTVDLVLPAAEWDVRRARRAIFAAIRDHCPDLFAISTDVELDRIRPTTEESS